MNIELIIVIEPFLIFNPQSFKLNISILYSYQIALPFTFLPQQHRSTQNTPTIL